MINSPFVFLLQFLHPFEHLPTVVLSATKAVLSNLFPNQVFLFLQQQHRLKTKIIDKNGGLLPVEYFNINGINARSCACVIFSTGVGIPSMIKGGSSNNDGSSCTRGGACCANAVSSSSITKLRRFFITSSSGLAPNTL